MSNDDSWQELKGFEGCEPTESAFRALVAALETWQGDDFEDAVVYADQLLSQWPDNVRVAPWSWCRAAALGIAPITWKLVRSLRLQSGHLTKDPVDLAWLADTADLRHITELQLPEHSNSKYLSLLYHRPNLFPSLRLLRAADRYNDADVRALAESPLWNSLESFETESLTESFAHREPSRIVPTIDRTSPIRHLSMRAVDLMATWDRGPLPHLRSADVFICSIDEARALARRLEPGQLTSLSLAFRCGFSGSAPFEPFVGTVIEADETAAEFFFSEARLDQLESLRIAGYATGYWGREGIGSRGLESLISSGRLKQVKSLHLELLPLGDPGVQRLATELGPQLQSLRLKDVYCKGDGAVALADSPCLATLRELDLSGNRISAEGAVRLAEAAMPQLELLDLSGPHVNPYYWSLGVQPILDEGAAAWASSSNAARLKQLKLSNCHLSDAALSAVFQSTNLRQLTELDLSHSAFSAAALSASLPGSSLWQTLTTLRLNDCRLGCDEITALTSVAQAPALRTLELQYNSIAPAGAAALADWPVLASVWQLDLHDNLIGNDGLIALAQSPYLGRLLELDLEQDCWNSRHFTFNNAAGQALVESASLPRLDSLFSGCVDEYHGTAYSPGFTKQSIKRLSNAEWLRPALKAACRDYSGVGDFIESGVFDESKELDKHDFRGHPYALDEREADEGPQRLRQLSSSRPSHQSVTELGPPSVSDLPETHADHDHVIKGLDHRDPIPVIDHRATLSMAHDDAQRPLPDQAAKVLADTLGSLLRACAAGNFEIGGTSSRQNDDGEFVEVSSEFHVGIAGSVDRALGLIREALWWIGAPAGTDCGEYPLGLDSKPTVAIPGFLQLATPIVKRWSSGHRLDRVPFSETQRNKVSELLVEHGAEEGEDGWAPLTTADGGQISVFVRYLDDGDEFNTLNILCSALSPDIVQLIHQMMVDCDFMLLPMTIAATDRTAQTLDCEWPEVRVIESAESLYACLSAGPWQWWQHTARS